MKLYEKIAMTVSARLNCIARGNAEWKLRHQETLCGLVSNHMPRGSGFDAGTEIDLDLSNGERLVFHTSYHHMDENGSYNGWTSHIVRVYPAFSGIRMTITGKNNNDINIKDYVYECFDCALNEEVEV